MLLAIIAAVTAQSGLWTPTAAGLRRLHAAVPGITDACLARIRTGGIGAMPTRVDQCFRMTAPRRWRGLWLDAFEGQRFCPAPARSCVDGPGRDKVWLSFADGRHPTGKSPTDHVYRIDFIGRRTLLPGYYGHISMSMQELIVDRLLAIAPATAADPTRQR